ncbi:BA75_01865T0 [Komagataella pastoris]|uniref:BA75_01865T0 n=1 Tax=Komagataella pastoris TaxID=4922 RepID=A0A1B2JE09_PICPA|nr:BA75_01865T0 [Komagataella pastoris]
MLNHELKLQIKCGDYFKLRHMSLTIIAGLYLLRGNRRRIKRNCVESQIVTPQQQVNHEDSLFTQTFLLIQVNEKISTTLQVLTIGIYKVIRLSIIRINYRSFLLQKYMRIFPDLVHFCKTFVTFIILLQI